MQIQRDCKIRILKGYPKTFTNLRLADPNSATNQYNSTPFSIALNTERVRKPYFIHNCKMLGGDRGRRSGVW